MAKVSAAALLLILFAAATVRTVTIPFAVGEHLVYDVSWADYLTAGEAVLSVRDERRDGAASAYYITAEGRTTGLVGTLYALSYKADTLLDTRTLLPIQGSLVSQEGRRTRNKVTVFNRRAERALFEMRTATVVNKEIWSPRDAQDALSAIFVLRTLQIEPGTRHVMTVCDSSRLYRLVFQVEGRETIETGLGIQRAVRISPAIFDETGKPQGRGLALWLSDDARHMPLKLSAELPVGAITLLLRQAGR